MNYGKLLKWDCVLLYFCAAVLSAQEVSIGVSRIEGITVTSPALIAEGKYWHRGVEAIPETAWHPLFALERYDTGEWIVSSTVEIHNLRSSETVGIFSQWIFSAYEVYWDSTLLIRNGVVGETKERESAGTFSVDCVIPPSLLKEGKHRLVIHLSNYSSSSPWKWYYGQLQIAYYREHVRSEYEFGYMIFLTGGIMIFSLLFNLFLYFARGRLPEHFFLSVACAVTLLNHIILQAPFYLEFSSTYVHTIFNAFLTSQYIRSIFFPAFYLYFHSITSRKVFFVIVGIINTVVAILGILEGTFMDAVVYTLFAESIIILGWAVSNRKDGSVLNLLGVLGGFVTYALSIRYFGFGTVLVIASTLAIGKQYVQKERAEREARLKAARMEIELLKKIVNPHFLLNSLTSVIAWLRKHPSSAIRFIETLSEEFRLIMRVSNLNLIPIEDEIELCRKHLEVMSFRKGMRYSLVTRALTNDECIPPLIFHTLIENAITHSAMEKKEGTFLLTRQEQETAIYYTLSHNCGYGSSSTTASSGVGMKYVRTRLEEQYPQRWRITETKGRGWWKTTIEIQRKKV